MLKPFAQNIWTLDGDRVRMGGVLPFTTRMTIVRLRAGDLWLHSPVRPTPERQQTVNRLGPVAHIIAPNKIHSLGISAWSDLHPSATVWVSPGFTDRHPDIEVDAMLQTHVSPPWGDEIDHCLIEGHLFLDEVAFLHKPSKTLILTDYIQKHDTNGETWFWRVIKRAAGVLGKRGGTSIDIKLSVENRQALRNSIDTILQWDFDNLIIAHGTCIRGGAKGEVRRAFDWVMRAH